VVLISFCCCLAVYGLPGRDLQALELELKPIHTQKTQTPALRADVHARALRASQNAKRAEVRRIRNVRRLDLADVKYEGGRRDLVGRGLRFLLARTPNYSPPDVETGKSTPHSLHSLPVHV